MSNATDHVLNAQITPNTAKRVSYLRTTVTGPLMSRRSHQRRRSERSFVGVANARQPAVADAGWRDDGMVFSHTLRRHSVLAPAGVPALITGIRALTMSATRRHLPADRSRFGRPVGVP